jgi:hypothetical protein
MSRPVAIAAAAVTVGALALAVACATEGNAQSTGAGRIVPDDTAAVARLLVAVRGAPPLYCEMATRNVDMHGSWSRWGPMGGDPLETDSASAAMLSWIQRAHNDPAVVPRLRAALHDDDACVRRVAGSFLARVEHSSATGALLSALDDAKAETREVAAVGLGMAEYAAAVDPLISRLKDSSPAVRRAAAWALGSIEAKKAVPALMTMLSTDSDPHVRQAAAWAIGSIKP